jgi:prepilin-type N-terminal cleavage/methylation domain-containing protein
MGLYKNRWTNKCAGHCLLLNDGRANLLTIKKDNGFTLVEILAALGIFSFAVLGLAIGTVTMIRTNQNSYLFTTASNLGQAKLEEFRAMSSAAASGLPCPSYGASGCSDTRLGSGVVFTRSWQVTANSPAPGVTKVDVKIDWTDYAPHTLAFTASVP